MNTGGLAGLKRQRNNRPLLDFKLRLIAIFVLQADLQNMRALFCAADRADHSA